jgi:ribosomal protein S8
VFVIMNFRSSIKQLLARVRVAEKKKDLKVTVNFKKELFPFLQALILEGVICQFAVKKKTIVVRLKKTKAIARFKQEQMVLRDFGAAAVLYRNPTALLFLSTTFGVVPKKAQTIGGTLLFLTY